MEPPPSSGWQCSRTFTSYDRSPVTRGRSAAEYPLLHGPSSGGGWGYEKGSKGHKLISSIQVCEIFGSILLIGEGRDVLELTTIGAPPPPWSDTVTVTVIESDSATGFVMEYA